MPTAAELHDQLHPRDPDLAIRVAEAYLRERGDIPVDVYLQLGRIQADPGAMMRHLDAMRREHFAKQGKAPPDYGLLL